MRKTLRWFLGTPEGRVWLALLLGPVLVLNIAGHSAMSLHIVVVDNGCGCAMPRMPSSVIFDKTVTDLGVVQDLQGAMNGAPMAASLYCSPGLTLWYTFDFETLGGVVVQSYTSPGSCSANKYTLGIPPFGLLDGTFTTYVQLGAVAYQGQGLFPALHHDIGLPMQS